MIIDLTKETFEKEVIESAIPVLVDFWAPWCNPCRSLSPVIDEISQEMGEKLKVCKVNVDEEGLLSVEQGIMSIPSLFLFKDGKVEAKSVGVRTKDELLEMIEKSIG
jgi:thioredoxin 1